MLVFACCQSQLCTACGSDLGPTSECTWAVGRLVCLRCWLLATAPSARPQSLTASTPPAWLQRCAEGLVGSGARLVAAGSAVLARGQRTGTMKPLAIDLFCGLGGWTRGLLDAGFNCVGFDIEAQPEYPGEFVLTDVLTLHGPQFQDATLIVASPPCQAYSYRAMPWKRAKALPPPDNTLFEACFRIQQEASEAAGHRIPLVVENVKGAQPWVGRAKWHYGPWFLWGDLPAIMPFDNGIRKGAGSGRAWFYQNGGNARSASSKSAERRAWTASVSIVPFELASWIGRCYYPDD